MDRDDSSREAASNGAGERPLAEASPATPVANRRDAARAALVTAFRRTVATFEALGRRAVRRAVGARRLVAGATRRAVARVARWPAGCAAMVAGATRAAGAHMRATTARVRTVGARVRATTARVRTVGARVRTATTRMRTATARAGAAITRASQPARWRDAVRKSRRSRASARAAARLAHAIRREALRRTAHAEAARRRISQRQVAARRGVYRLVVRERARRRRRRRLLIATLVMLLVVTGGLAAGAFYVDQIPTPAQLTLPESTTVYFSDGVTPIARLGTENRTVLAFDEMNEAVKWAIVAAEDRTFWTHPGITFPGVLRAAWQNATGGTRQGASTITQQYARIAADLRGLTYARKAREAMLAWKIEQKYSKEEILAFYLNTVAFGRGAHGIEAAAQAFFGKTSKRAAPSEQQVTLAEAMVLASLVRQPEPNPDDPDGQPGYDPARGGRAAANSLSRWEYVREGLIELGYLSRADADALTYPHTVLDLDASQPDELAGPIGLAVSHVLSELRQADPFRGQAPDFIRNGGFRIVTTLDRRVQAAAEAAADIRRASAPAAVRGQPENWQAALVAVEPGTGRVLAYYGGNQGTGADHAGWFYDETGQARGFGQHPPGSSAKVYVLAEALRQQISLWSRWPSPATKEFPASGRTRGSTAGPVRNATSARCQPNCTLWEATVASLNVTFFDLTERLGPANVIDMARRAGIDSMWTDRGPTRRQTRVDLRGTTGNKLVANPGSNAPPGLFSTEVGIGQYGVTVLDQANAMATFAAHGKRAQAHFVRDVTRRGERVYAEQLTQTDIGLRPEQVDELTWVLGQVPSAKLEPGWDSAGKTGTWQAANSTTRNAHTWMVGYTGALAAAVWLGTTDGAALATRDRSYDVFGATHPAPIWRQFMVDALRALELRAQDYRFRSPDRAPSAAPTPPPTATPAAHR